MEKIPVPQPGRESYLKHQRDVTRQIILPVALVAVFGAGLGALIIYAATGASPGVSLWADIATIWIVIPLMVMMLVILTLLAGLAYGLARLLKVTPRYTGIAQTYVLWFNAQVSIWADKLTEPVLRINTWLTMLLKFFSKNEGKKP
jgi:hypothetical protein